MPNTKNPMKLDYSIFYFADIVVDSFLFFFKYCFCIVYGLYIVMTILSSLPQLYVVSTQLFLLNVSTFYTSIDSYYSICFRPVFDSLYITYFYTVLYILCIFIGCYYSFFLIHQFIQFVTLYTFFFKFSF